MHVHILGICGTFMGSLAQLAKASGHRVTGSDTNVYPPMSRQLEAAGIELIEGFDPSQLALNPDLIVVGNVVSRGNAVIEDVLDQGLPYVSGPQWLAEHILRDKWVLAVAGTHGKTTTSTMLAWILEYAGMAPGYLIGGVPANFPVSARLGDSDFFVIEADEYDTAFFDKRSKFVHYRPRTLIINNLEYDHADIFPNLAAIQTQFHHLMRILPRNGLLVHHYDPNIETVLEKGCWTPVQKIGADGCWRYDALKGDGSKFTVQLDGEHQGTVGWSLTGVHNIQNGVSAIAAARHVGVAPELACEALCEFSGVKRRMELIGQVGGTKIYDDFAHHPTAIARTLAGLRARVGDDEVIAVIEPRSNTMVQGVYKNVLLDAIGKADIVFWYQGSELPWELAEYVTFQGRRAHGLFLRGSSVFDKTEDIISAICQENTRRARHIVIMSNGGFLNIHQRLIDSLRQKAQE